MKPEIKRLIAAVIVAPLAMGLVAAVVGAFAGGGKAAWYFFIGTTGFATAFGLVYGVPLHLLLRRLGRTGIAGYLIGAVPAALIISALNAEFVGLQIAFDALPGGVISVWTLILASLFTASIAWGIARPDKRGAD